MSICDMVCLFGFLRLLVEGCIMLDRCLVSFGMSVLLVGSVCLSGCVNSGSRTVENQNVPYSDMEDIFLTDKSETVSSESSSVDVSDEDLDAYVRVQYGCSSVEAMADEYGYDVTHLKQILRNDIKNGVSVYHAPEGASKNNANASTDNMETSVPDVMPTSSEVLDGMRNMSFGDNYCLEVSDQKYVNAGVSEGISSVRFFTCGNKILLVKNLTSKFYLEATDNPNVYAMEYQQGSEWIKGTNADCAGCNPVRDEELVKRIVSTDWPSDGVVSFDRGLRDYIVKFEGESAEKLWDSINAASDGTFDVYYSGLSSHKPSDMKVKSIEIFTDLDFSFTRLWVRFDTSEDPEYGRLLSWIRDRVGDVKESEVVRTV